MPINMNEVANLEISFKMSINNEILNNKGYCVIFDNDFHSLLVKIKNQEIPNYNNFRFMLKKYLQTSISRYFFVFQTEKTK